MDRYAKGQQNRTFNRVQDVKVSAEFKAGIEKMALAHLHQGNVDEYIIAMNSLAKLDSAKALDDRLNSIEGAVASLVKEKG